MYYFTISECGQKPHFIFRPGMESPGDQNSSLGAPQHQQRTFVVCAGAHNEQALHWIMPVHLQRVVDPDHVQRVQSSQSKAEL